MHNYLKKMAELELPADGKLNVVNWHHDNWCRLLRRIGECNCDPVAELIRDVTMEQFLAYAMNPIETGTKD